MHDLARNYVNFLHPVRRMTEKVRLGARVTRRYDTAQTPYRRLLASGVLSEAAALNWRIDPLLSTHCASSSSSNRLSARSLHPQFSRASFARSWPDDRADSHDAEAQRAPYGPGQSQ